MHTKKLIKTMHEKAWTDQELKKGINKIKQIKEKEPKKENKFNYWTSIFFLTTLVFLSSLGLVPIITLNQKNLSFLLVIILGIIFGTLASETIVNLEEYNKKHHRIWCNIVLFLFFLGLSSIILESTLSILQNNVSGFVFALIYKLSFAVFPTYLIFNYEKEYKKINKYI